MAPEIPLVLEAPRRGALRPYEELLHRGFDLGCRAGRDMLALYSNDRDS